WPLHTTEPWNVGMMNGAPPSYATGLPPPRNSLTWQRTGKNGLKIPGRSSLSPGAECWRGRNEVRVSTLNRPRFHWHSWKAAFGATLPWALYWRSAAQRHQPLHQHIDIDQPFRLIKSTEHHRIMSPRVAR